MMKVYAGPRANRSGNHRAGSAIGQRTINANLNRAGIQGEQRQQIMTNYANNPNARVRSTRGMTNG